MKRESRAFDLVTADVVVKISAAAGTVGDFTVSLEVTFALMTGEGRTASISAGLSTFLKNIAMDFEGGAGGAHFAADFDVAFGAELAAVLSLSIEE
jgi:hypothetical protein